MISNAIMRLMVASKARHRLAGHKMSGCRVLRAIDRKRHEQCCSALHDHWVSTVSFPVPGNAVIGGRVQRALGA